MIKYQKFILQACLILGSILYFIFMFKNYKINELLRLPGQIILSMISIRVFSFFSYQLSNMYFFKVFHENISFMKVVLISTASSVSNYSTPVKLGLPLQVYLMKRMVNIPFTKGTSIVFLHLLISYTVALILSLMGIFSLSLDLFESANFKFTFIFILFLLTTIYCIYIFMKRFGTQIDVTNKIVIKLKEMQKILREINYIYLLIVLILVFLSFFLSACIQYFVIIGLNETVSLYQLFLIQGIPFILGGLSMIPMGLGVKDASLTFLIHTIGVSNPTAMTSALIIRLFSVGFSIPIGLISINYLVHKGLLQKNRKK